MFTTLVESRAPRARRMGGTLVSAVVHGALIAGAVVVTLPGHVDATPKPVRPDTVIWVPIDHGHDRPQSTRPAGVVREAGPAVPVVRVKVDFPDLGRTNPPTDPGPVVTAPDVFGPHGGVSTATPMGGGVPTGLGGGSVWDSHQVDRAPAVAGRAIEPAYPAPLRAAGIEGRAVLQFVVDTLGRAELGDVSVVETSHPLFAEAVRQVLPRYRFVPGEAAGRKVRTRVQIPFDFRLDR